MLDSYKDKWPIVYKILSSSIKENKISHSYLFESNGSKEALNLAIEFSKSILCPYFYLNYNNCVNCTQCKKITENEFSELLIIEPDGLWIKKEQTDYIQHLFETKSVESKYRVYIINHAEKMNLSAANSILKFLEEPEEGIIAILITNNRYELLDTIRSRCQIITLNNRNGNEISPLVKIKNSINSISVDEMTEEELNAKITDAINFINYYEKNGLDTLLYTDKLFHSIFNTRDLVIFAFDIWILYYRDILAIINGISNIIFENSIDDIKNIIKNNSVKKIMKKIKIIMSLKKNIQYNVNINLLMDKLVIDLEKSDMYEEGSWS